MLDVFLDYVRVFQVDLKFVVLLAKLKEKSVVFLHAKIKAIKLFSER